MKTLEEFTQEIVDVLKTLIDAYIVHTEIIHYRNTYAIRLYFVDKKLGFAPELYSDRYVRADGVVFFTQTAVIAIPKIESDNEPTKVFVW
jgi:hypothetical protein